MNIAKIRNRAKTTFDFSRGFPYRSFAIVIIGMFSAHYIARSNGLIAVFGVVFTLAIGGGMVFLTAFSYLLMKK